MPRLNNRIQQSILSKLDESPLSSGPFNFEFPDNNPIVRITVKNEEDYEFEISENGNNTFDIVQKPGEIYSTANFRVQNLDKAIDLIRPWIDTLLDDYKARSIIYGEFEKTWLDIQDQMKSHSADDSLHFTLGEKEQILAKLSELEEKYHELLNKKKITPEQFESLKEILSEAEKQADILPKEVWWRSVSRKIFNFGKLILSSKEARQLLLMEAKHLLLPESNNQH